MKHKLLKTLVVSLGLVCTATVITNTEQSQNVEASKSDDIFAYGYWTEHPNKYFKNWKTVVSTSKLYFTNSVDTHVFINPYEYTNFPSNKTLPAGQIFQVKRYDGEWLVRGKAFPVHKGFYWFLPDEFDDYSSNARFYEGNNVRYNFATTDSYVGLSTIFIPSRKVKVIKPVMAYKIKQEVPAYKNHIVGKTKIKKGTILTVTGPSNHWTLKVSGKGVREHYPYMWNVGKRSGWYKLID